jgi:hypothetical protein
LVLLDVERSQMKASVFPHRTGPSVTALAALAVLSLAVAGCGGGGTKEATLTGKVTYKDQPVKGGTVRVVPADGNLKEAVQGNISPEGNYSVAIPSALKDKDVKILVETESVKQQSAGYRMPANVPAEFKGQVNPQAGAPPGGFEYVQIPAKYNDPKGTPLTAKIKGGKQTENLALTD